MGKKTSLLGDLFGFITFWAIWFYDWEILFMLFLNLAWFFSDNSLIFWGRIILTGLLIVVWLYLRFRSDKEKEVLRKQVP